VETTPAASRPDSEDYLNADKDVVWSWWKVILLFPLIYKVYLSHIQLPVDELQIEMNERERRANDRNLVRILFIFFVICPNFIAVERIQLRVSVLEGP
jgi:phage shock protein PspC (stress-responsive transcriptional regulator)